MLSTLLRKKAADLIVCFLEKSVIADSFAVIELMHSGLRIGLIKQTLTRPSATKIVTLTPNEIYQGDDEPLRWADEPSLHFGLWIMDYGLCSEHY